MNTCKTVNTLLLPTSHHHEAGILQEIAQGTDRGLQYMQRLFHLELWYFACSFTEEQQAFELALTAIQEHWQVQVEYNNLETLLEVIYVSAVLHCMHFIKVTDRGLQIKEVHLVEADFCHFLEQRKKAATAYAIQVRNQMHAPILN